MYRISGYADGRTVVAVFDIDWQGMADSKFDSLLVSEFSAALLLLAG